MRRREAERFEEALQRAKGGEEVQEAMLPLVQTAQMATALAGPTPAPPHGLMPGRQRFLAEAASLRPFRTAGSQGRIRRFRLLRTVAALLTLVLALGLVAGAGLAVAESLPGETLYGLKLTAEEIRLNLTRDPLAQAELNRVLARKRMAEVVRLAESGRVLGDPTTTRVEQQLVRALQAAARVEDVQAKRVLQRLEQTVREQERAMTKAFAAAAGSEQKQLREVLRVMERVRQETQFGQEDPEGLRQRLHFGLPSEPADPSQPNHVPAPGTPPGNGKQSPGSRPGAGPSPGLSPTPEAPKLRSTGEAGNGSGRGTQPTDRPVAPKATETPHSGSGARPTEKPSGPDRTGEPGLGSSSPDPSRQPNEGSGPGPQPNAGQDGPEPTTGASSDPGESKPTDRPGSDPRSEPSSEPGGPGPTGQPGGPEPDPESTGEPQGPEPPGQPGGDSEPTEAPDEPDPLGGGDPGPGPGPQPPDGNGSGGHRKP